MYATASAEGIGYGSGSASAGDASASCGVPAAWHGPSEILGQEILGDRNVETSGETGVQIGLPDQSQPRVGGSISETETVDHREFRTSVWRSPQDGFLLVNEDEQIVDVADPGGEIALSGLIENNSKQAFGAPTPFDAMFTFSEDTLKLSLVIHR
jgi:hypothetical protein